MKTLMMAGALAFGLLSAGWVAPNAFADGTNPNTTTNTTQTPQKRHHRHHRHHHHCRHHKHHKPADTTTNPGSTTTPPKS